MSKRGDLKGTLEKEFYIGKGNPDSEASSIIGVKTSSLGKAEYKDSGGPWTPLTTTFNKKVEHTTEDLTIYVATTGNDATGDGSIGNPYATITYAYSLVPRVIRHKVKIMVANGVYSGFPAQLEPMIEGEGSFLLDGYEHHTEVESTEYTVTSLDAEYGFDCLLIKITGASWTPGALYAKCIQISAGANKGYLAPIWDNTADTITIKNANFFPAADIVGTSFKIVQQGVRIDVDHGVSIGEYANNNTSKGHGLLFYNCRWVMDYATYDYITPRNIDINNKGACFIGCDFEIQYSMSSLTVSGRGVNTTNAAPLMECSYIDLTSGPPYAYAGLWHFTCVLAVSNTTKPTSRQYAIDIISSGDGFYGTTLLNIITWGNLSSLSSTCSIESCVAVSVVSTHMANLQIIGLTVIPVNADQSIRVSQYGRAKLRGVYVKGPANEAVYAHQGSQVMMDDVLDGNDLSYVYRLEHGANVVIQQAPVVNGTTADIRFDAIAVNESYPANNSSVTDGQGSRVIMDY